MYQMHKISRLYNLIDCETLDEECDPTTTSSVSSFILLHFSFFFLFLFFFLMVFLLNNNDLVFSLDFKK